MAEGTAPTVALAAERADVSRTTAYRYFPSQESLLLEVAMGDDVADIEHLVEHPDPDRSPVERTAELLRTFNQHVVRNEVRYRTAQRLYTDLWLAAAAEGDPDPFVREGRRTRWIESTLADELASLPQAQRNRLVAALAMLAGPEPMSTLRDVAHLAPDEAVEVADWMVRTLLDAVLARHSPPATGAR